MTTGPPDAAAATLAVLEDYSVEITGKDLAALPHAALPPGTRVNVTYLAHEDLRMRLDTARGVGDLGLVPVPHLSARRLASHHALRELLGELAAQGSAAEMFVIGGDPRSPEGPFVDARSVIDSGELERYGVRAVGLAGYPEGHPHLSDATLWQALADKTAALQRRGIRASVTTQFGFDADRVLAWVAEARRRGLDVPIRVGVPGPAGTRRLLGYAARCGVATSAGITRKYGLSLTNLMSATGPDRFLRALGAGYDERDHGELGVHFFTFGQVTATAEWIRDFHAGPADQAG